MTNLVTFFMKHCILDIKGKGLGTCYSAAYMQSALQSRKWQVIGIQLNDDTAAH